MCTCIYVGSQNPLPEIPWNEESPGFYILKEPSSEYLDEVLQSPFIYDTGSFMGCACGLSYWEESPNGSLEDYGQRVKDVQDFASYLDTNKHNNQLKIFSTDWSEFPDTYEQKDFSTSEITEGEFYFEDLVVLRVV